MIDNINSGDIIRVKDGVNWHPNYIGRTYKIYPISVFYDKQLDYKLIPHGSGHEDIQPIFIEKKDLNDIIKVDAMEPQMFIKKIEL